MISPIQLIEFGLNKKEAKIYLASLELGPNSVQNIAHQANVNRVTTYDILGSLIKKGLISQTIKGKKKLLIAVQPENILNTLKQKQDNFSSLLPELKAIQNKNQTKPKVMYFEGRQAVWQAYLDRIQHQPELKENLVYGSAEKLFSLYKPEFQKYTQARIAQGIHTKVILEKSQASLWQKETADQHLRQVKFLPQNKKFTTETVIYGNRILMVSWEPMLAIIIEDKHNANNQRMVFNLLWEYLP